MGDPTNMDQSFEGVPTSQLKSSTSNKLQNSALMKRDLVLSTPPIDPNELSENDRNIAVTNSLIQETERKLRGSISLNNDSSHSHSYVEPTNPYHDKVKQGMLELSRAHNVSREELFSRRVFHDAQAQLLASSKLLDASRQNSLTLFEATKRLDASRQDSLALLEATKRLESSRQDSLTLLEATKLLDASRQNSLTLLEASKLLETSRQESLSLLEATNFLDVSRQDSLKLFEVSRDTNVSREEFYSKLLGEHAEKDANSVDPINPYDQKASAKTFPKNIALSQCFGLPSLDEVSRQESYSKLFEDNDETKKKSEHPAMYRNSEAFRNALSSLSIQNIYSNYPHAVANAVPQEFAPTAVPSSSINLDSLRGSSDQSKVIESLKPNAHVPVYPGGIYPHIASNQQLGTSEMGVPNALLLLNNPYQFHPMAQAAYLNNPGWNGALNQGAQRKVPDYAKDQQGGTTAPGKSADSIAQCPPKKGRGRPKRNPKEGWPKRPLSAYNIFFKNEREKLLKSMKEPAVSNDPNGKLPRTRKNRQAKHGKISFSDLAKTIGSKWKKLNQEEKNQYEILAAYNLQKYKEELKEFTEKREKEKALSSK